VIDRLHVQKLACDALQEMNISYRWHAINEETETLENAKYTQLPYTLLRFENGKTK